MGVLSRAEFEMDCIREFAHSGTQIGPTISREERRERIRAAIFREGKQHSRWRDTHLTYAAAYQQAYNQPLQARHGDTQSPPMPLASADFGDEDSEDSEDEVENVRVQDAGT